MIYHLIFCFWFFDVSICFIIRLFVIVFFWLVFFKVLFRILFCIFICIKWISFLIVCIFFVFVIFIFFIFFRFFWFDFFVIEKRKIIQNIWHGLKVKSFIGK